jgi:BolA family transcriptional regulator, general stress-responsive regulator
MSIAEQLRARLVQSLQPARLEIVDESELHRGHGGWREGGETHFRVVVVSGRFAGRSRVERQRLVHEAAGDLLRERIHALSIRALSPGEAEGTVG